MSKHKKTLVEGANRWRQLQVTDYWLHLSYIGGDLNRVGEHEVTRAEGKLWHSKDGGDWLEVKTGAFYWLFSIEGLLVWARDIITKVLPAAGDEVLEMTVNEDFGYVEYIKLDMAKRDGDNMTIEVKEFGLGAHPDF